MQSLDAALAFAITMLILSMVVTTIVETIHRIRGLREKGLELLLGRFYDRIIAARGLGAGDAGSRQAFIEMMTVNRAPIGDAPLRPRASATPEADDKTEDTKLLSWVWGGRRLGKLGAMAFMERLGGSAYGASIVNQAAAAGDQAVLATLKDLTQKFEAFRRESSEYFESRARLVSVLVALVLAVALNVNAFTLFDTFMRNPEVARAVIDKGSAAQGQYVELNRQLQELKNAQPDAVRKKPAIEVLKPVSGHGDRLARSGREQDELRRL